MIAPRLNGDVAPGGRGDVRGLMNAMERYNARLVLYDSIYVYERIPPHNGLVALEFYHDLGIKTGRALSRWTRDFREATFWHADLINDIARGSAFDDVWRDEDGVILEASARRLRSWDGRAS